MDLELEKKKCDNVHAEFSKLNRDLFPSTRRHDIYYVDRNLGTHNFNFFVKNCIN